MAKRQQAVPQASGGGMPEVVDPRWLVRAAVGMLVVGLVCGYATFCVLFYQGQWQVMLHPVRTSSRPATIGGDSYQVVRFGPDATGRPARVGWWVPAAPGGRFAALTVLVLPSGSGSLVDAQQTLEQLHGVGVGVFGIDYEGYGDSLDVHPSEARMRADAEAAWRYVTQEQKVPGARVIPYGVGVGGALALGLARAHPEAPAIVLDRPAFDVAGAVRADPRVRLLPVMLLLKDRFALEPELRTLKTPKLILTDGGGDSQKSQGAADPKMTVALPKRDEAEFQGAMRRFLDTFAPSATLGPPGGSVRR